jgi:hypothetical protein
VESYFLKEFLLVHAVSATLSDIEEFLDKNAHERSLA